MFHKYSLLLLFFIFSQAHTFSIDKALCPVNLNAAVIHTSEKSDLKKFFSPDRLLINQETTIVTNPLELQKLARDTLFYINRYEQAHKHVISPTHFDRDILPLQRVKSTLRTLISLIEEDKNNGTPFRILNQTFLKKHFGCIKWTGDATTARKKNELCVKDGKIRLTHYAVFQCSGSYNKTKEHTHALYKLLSHKNYLPYTKQQVLKGILNKKENKKKVRPLVWLSREALEEALMQGTIFVTMPDGKKRIFNVDISNDIDYNKNIKNMRNQKRYWYFREIASHLASDLLKRFSRRKNIVFAGDIYSIGIGKLIAISYQNQLTKQEELRLGILADTGGAFLRNLYQLDSFAGIFASRQELKKQTRFFPDTVNSYILYKRS